MGEVKMNRGKEMDRIIDQALRDYPLEPAPKGLTARVMGQIQHPLVAPRFKISWFDFALSGALALIIGYALDFIQGAAYSPYWSTRFRTALILFWQDFRYFLLHNQAPVMAVMLSTAVILALLGILASVYWRYAAYSKRLPA
jgi:hypothetical protein